jgi:hypothetical protein
MSVERRELLLKLGLLPAIGIGVLVKNENPKRKDIWIDSCNISKEVFEALQNVSSDYYIVVRGCQIG